MISAEKVSFTANKIVIKTNYDINLYTKNMHIPYAYEIFDTNMTNFVLTDNNQTFKISQFNTNKNNKYTLMFLQLGYTGIDLVNCNNNPNIKFPIVIPTQIPYDELKTRNPKLKKPLKFYKPTGYLPDYNDPSNDQKPIITAYNNSKKLQFISYTKVEFLNNKNEQLPPFVFDNRLFNNEIKFYFVIGGNYFDLDDHIQSPPIYQDAENNKYLLFNEIALVAIKDSLLYQGFNTLLNPDNITLDNFKIYAYKYLDIPLLIGKDKMVYIEWSLIAYMR